MEENPVDQKDQKRESIIEAAYKRFSHFGMSKTTMSEIAADLKISKPLLYYYFPEKTELFLAVMRRVFLEHIELSEKVLESYTDMQRALWHYIDLRYHFFIENRNLWDFTPSSAGLLNNPAIKKMLLKGRERELKIILRMLNAGCERGEFTIRDPRLTAELILDSLHGMRLVVLGQANRVNPLIPSEEDVKLITDRQKKWVEILVKGLVKGNSI